MQRAAFTASSMESSSALAMIASGKEGGGERMTMISGTAEEKPNYKMTAGRLLIACREFFKNPENEEEFVEWMKTGRQNLSHML